MSDPKKQKLNSAEAEKMQQIRDLLLGSHIRETGNKLDQVTKKIDEASSHQSAEFSKQLTEVKASFASQLQEIKVSLSSLIQDEVSQSNKLNSEKIADTLKSCMDRLDKVEKDGQSKLEHLEGKSMDKKALADLLRKLSDNIALS